MLKLLGGEVYFQQYEQKKELGRGKFGVVFRVQDKDNKRTYAAKHIKTRKKEQRERVIEEIAILKKFKPMLQLEILELIKDYVLFSILNFLAF